MNYNISRLLILLLLTCGSCSLFQHSGKTGNRIISGIVTGEDGKPMKDIEVRLYETSRIQNQVLTAENGKFSLEYTGTGDCILELSGISGKGRVSVPASVKSSLRLTYPVKEKIIILHNNDQHFNYTMKEELQKTFEKFRKENRDVYYFNAGDIFVRYAERWIINEELKDSAWYGIRSKFMVGNLNELGCDLLVPGNHELDYVGKYTREALDLAKFPVLAANSIVTTDKLPRMEPFKIFQTTTGRNIAVLGLSAGNRKEGLSSQNPDETIKKYLYLDSQNDLFLAVTHVGFNRDTIIANTFPQFDVIIGGHSHTNLPDGFVQNNVLVAQAAGNDHIVHDSNPNYLGVVTIELKNGIIANRTARIIKFIPTK